jgi:hypothetical protein
MWAFMNDPAYVRVIAGPVGSGKSVCCSHELVKLALSQAPNDDGERKTRHLIVRNTADQLRSTTMKTFMDWFPPGKWGIFKASERTFYMDLPLEDGTRVKAEFMFIALDTPDDVRKALSLEATFLWGNEWRELHPNVVDGLLMRLRRYPSMKDGGFTRSGALFDTNMPDMDSWHQDKMEEPPSNWSVYTQPPAVLAYDEYVATYSEDPDVEPVDGYDDTQWYVNPGADNVDHLDPQYYPEIIPGKTSDFIDVYLRCRYGRSLSGVPVYDKTFTQDFHIAETPYEPLRASEYPVIIGLDFGRTPAAVLMQRNVRGQVIVLAEETSENMGIETFLNKKLKPLIVERFSGCAFLVAPDPAGWSKQQIGEISPVDVLKAEGFKVVKPATNDPERRIQAVERLLTMNTDGKPAFLINPGCLNLIRGFKYGYRYKVNKIGSQDAKPEKNSFSHCHDAAQYACLVIEGNQIRGSYAGHAQRRDIKRVNYVWV